MENVFYPFSCMFHRLSGKNESAEKTPERLKMMKHLWLYPLVFAVMIAAVLGCMIRIGYLLHTAKDSRVHAGAQFVMEVERLAQI